MKKGVIILFVIAIIFIMKKPNNNNTELTNNLNNFSENTSDNNEEISENIQLDNSVEPLEHYTLEKEQAAEFSAWVTRVPGVVFGQDITAEQRHIYADTQNNASDALLAYEKAKSRYATTRGIVKAAQLCDLRPARWVMSLNQKLRRASDTDPIVQNAKQKLSALEVETGDVFSVYETFSHTQWVVGNSINPNCSSILNMPFLSTLDQYQKGTISSFK